MDSLPRGRRNRDLACDLDAQPIRNPGTLELNRWRLDR